MNVLQHDGWWSSTVITRSTTQPRRACSARWRRLLGLCVCVFCMMQLPFAPALADNGNLFDKLRFKSVRIVPQTELTDWTPRQIAVGIDATVGEHLSDEDAAFAAQFQRHLQDGLRRQGFTMSNNASTHLKITIDTLNQGDPETPIVGGLLSRGAVFGTVKILENGEFRGSYQFSSRVRNLSSATTFDQLAQKIAPRLADKLVSGIRDDILHSYRNKSLKSS